MMRMSAIARHGFVLAALLTVLGATAVAAPHHPLSQIYPMDTDLNLSGQDINELGDVRFSGGKSTFHGTVNMSGNEIVEYVTDARSGAPTNPAAGQMWFDSGQNVLKYYNGTRWVITASASTQAQQDLQSVLGADNSAGSYDINMSGQDIYRIDKLQIRPSGDSMYFKPGGGATRYTLRFDDKDLRFWNNNANTVLRLEDTTGNIVVPNGNLSVAGNLDLSGNVLVSASTNITLQQSGGDDKLVFWDEYRSRPLMSLDFDGSGPLKLTNTHLAMNGNAITNTGDLTIGTGSNNPTLNMRSGTDVDNRLQMYYESGSSYGISSSAPALRMYSKDNSGNNAKAQIELYDGNSYTTQLRASEKSQFGGGIGVGGALDMNGNNITNIGSSNVHLASWDSTYSEVGKGIQVRGGAFDPSNERYIGLAGGEMGSTPFFPWGHDGDSDWAMFYSPDTPSNNAEDFRLYIEDDGDGSERFSIWGNSCSGGCHNVNNSEELFRFGSDGDALAKGTWSGSSLDIAEYHRSSSTEPGTVLCMAGENMMAPCTKYADTSVTGIVSTDPMVAMGKYKRTEVKATPGSEDFGKVNMTTHAPVALSGKVPVKVTIEEGRTIRPGDLLTTASKTGYATLMDDPKVGAVLGKAAERFDGTEGTIKIWLR